MERTGRDLGRAQGVRRGHGTTGLRAAAAVALAAAVLLGLTALGEAWREPEGFKGVRWGAGPEEMTAAIGIPAAAWSRVRTEKEEGLGIQRYRLVRESHNACVGQESCARLEALRLGDVDLSSVTFSYLGGRFSAVAFAFEATEYPKVRAAFVERYGKPGGIQVQRYQNAFGAQFEAEELSWAGATTHIFLSEGVDLASRKGVASLVTVEFVRVLGGERTDQMKARQKALD